MKRNEGKEAVAAEREARNARLAAALRANLRRRKTSVPKDPGSATPTKTTPNTTGSDRD